MTRRTEAQRHAIEIINDNLAVNAGAGTGKTKVLTERYIEILDRGRLEEGREVESIVGITFTKKASQEMKERIRSEIRARFDLDPKWRGYYRDLEKANISTIHSFCGNILKENPLEAGLDPLFSIMDDQEMGGLLDGVIGQVLEENLAYQGPVYRILMILEDDDMARLKANLYRIYNQIRSNGDQLVDVRDRTLAQIEGMEIPEDIDRQIGEDFLTLMEASRSNSKFNKLKEKAIWSNFIEGNYRGEERLEVLGDFQNYLGANKKHEDVVKRLGSNLEKALLEKESQYLWAYEGIFYILLEIDKTYREAKDQEGLLDYNDLEFETYKLLREREDLREKYQDKFCYLMVDEFQDTNSLQKNIFYLLSSKEDLLDRKNLFVVGDPKQSIYGFRGADQRVFQEVMEDIRRTSGQEALDLDQNFRSLNLIIDLVNEVFFDLIENYKPLRSFHQAEGIRSIDLIEKEDLEVPEGVSRARFNKIYEASLMADRIEDLVENHGYNYGDFALLFRASTNDRVYEEALKMRNIPYYNSGGDNLYERQEIRDILNALRSLASSYDRVSTVGFLRSPMVGLNDETIYRLLSSLEDDNIYRGLGKLDLEDGEELEKLSLGLGILEKYSLRKGFYSLDQLLGDLLGETNYLEILSLYEDGEQRINNVHKFRDLVRAYEEKEGGGLDGFLDHMTKIEELGLEEGQAQIRAETANLVKIMTIHKSKGLQFPVVLLPEMSRAMRTEMDSLIYNRELGLAFKYEKKASLYERIKEENALEEEEELKRILYVAMTRGEERLIIGNQGTARGLKKYLENLDEKAEINYLDYDFNYRLEEEVFRPIDEEALGLVDNSLDLPQLISLNEFDNRHFPSINISQFIEFRHCRRKFYYDYYRPLPDVFTRPAGEGGSNIIPALERGNIVHKFCESYRGEEDYRERLIPLVEAYGYDYSMEVERELEEFIVNYIGFHDQEYDKIYSEEHFYLKIEDTFISGIIDRIYVRDQKAYVYDFKTNTVGDREDLEEFYRPQLQLYAYAVERIFDLEVAFAGIVFLETGEVLEVDLAQGSLLNNLEEIKEFIRFIEGHNSPDDYKKRRSCDYCSYGKLCKRS